METRLLTVTEVARMAGFHENTIRRWINEGKLRATKFGVKWRVDARDWDKFITSLAETGANSSADHS